MRRNGLVTRGPPENPTPIPWPEWVSQLASSPDWQLSGLSRSPEIMQLFSAEGLTSFTADHPNNPATMRFFAPVGDDGGPVIAGMHFGERAEGASGCAHEGAIGAVLDSLLGFCNLVNESGGPTLNLTMRFCHPVPLMACICAHGSQTRVEGKKVFLKSSLVDPTDPNMVYVECDALFFNASSANPVAGFASKDDAPPSEAIRGLGSKYSTLSVHSTMTVMDTPWVQELAAKERLSLCTSLIAVRSSGGIGHGFVSQSERIKAEYFVGSDVFIGVFLACGECMGPPPNMHGGCIVSLHADSIIACARMRANALGVRAGRGALKLLSVNFRKLTPLWHTYAVRVTITKHEHDLASGCWSFCLRSEMLNPETNVLHSDAAAEFECNNDGPYTLLPDQRTAAHGEPFLSAL